jgi:hypothetical protein
VSKPALLGTVLPGFLPKHCVNLPADYVSVTKKITSLVVVITPKVRMKVRIALPMVRDVRR